MSAILEAALQAGARNWPVFQLSGTKKPLRGSHSFKDATTRLPEIERQWTQAPWCNIGLACGAFDGVPVVLDADGPGGLAKIEALQSMVGRFDTLEVQTARGRHFYFLAPPGVVIPKHTDKRAKKGDDGLDVMGRGSFVVMPPSINSKTGFTYRWANAKPLQVMSAALVAWCLQWHRKGEPGGAAKEPAAEVAMPPAGRPSYARVDTARAGPKAPLAARGVALWRKSELPKLLGALRCIPANQGYDHWYKVGAALHNFDPGPLGRAIFKAWAASAEGYNTAEDQAACDEKWAREYGKLKPGQKPRTIASLYEEAEVLQEQAGACEEEAPEEPEPSIGEGGTNGHHAAPAVAPQLVRLPRPILRFVDFTDGGQPLGSTTNAGIAIQNLGIDCRKDVFHEKMLVGGHPIDAWAGDLSDDVVHMLRKVIKTRYGFDPGEKNTRDATVQLCLENQFNPVTDYLDDLQWDGVERLERWVVTYMGAEDTALNREFGTLMLIAAVRRARCPGTKFDQIVVLEGKEGTGKSTALRILAGDDNFSDQSILAGSDREQQEAFRGIWIHEISELSGWKRAETERVTAFASRTEDRARPAYGRIRVDMKRRGILVATTNERAYLRKETGNRRFWPIDTGRIDLEALARDRDQLWAEAAEYEASGTSIVLGEEFRRMAGFEQDERMENDEWTSTVAAEVAGKNDTSITEILTGGKFTMRPSDIGQIEQNRVARVLKRLGYERYQQREGLARFWRYKLVSGDRAVT